MAYGFRDSGNPRQIVYAKVDSSTSTIVAGDLLMVATAGYVKQAGANDVPVGVAIDGCTAPGSDGATSIRMDVSPLSRYEYPADAGSVTQGLAFTWLDIGGPQSINIDATNDKVFYCHEVDTVRNTCTGTFLFPISRS